MVVIAMIFATNRYSYLSPHFIMFCQVSELRDVPTHTSMGL